TLFEQEDPAEAFYIVITGRVRIAQVTVEGHQVTIRDIGAGEMFGAVPLFTNAAYPATASAVVDSVAARWDRAATHRLMERYPHVVRNALAIVGTRLQELQNRYRELATERVEQRVARAILRLLGREPEAGMQVEFPVSRQDIAEMTGTTLYTVSRILSGWEHDGLLESGRMRIVVRKPDALAAIADDLRQSELPPAR
ncbi:MAG: Crp/Fnr family transcriptional regulator, partial [Acetobacteraceae bacterium]